MRHTHPAWRQRGESQQLLVLLEGEKLQREEGDRHENLLQVEPVLRRSSVEGRHRHRIVSFSFTLGTEMSFR